MAIDDNPPRADALSVRVRADEARRLRPEGYLVALVACGVFTAVALRLEAALDEVNIVMLFLLAVVGIALRYGRGPAALASFANVLAFDFFFVAPRLSFGVSDVQYVLIFAVMLAVGLGTDTLAGSTWLYLPLNAPMRTRGVLALRPEDPRFLLVPDQRQQLETFAALTAIALERVHYVDVAQGATVQIESERLRKSLLAALSHDLRTPLAGPGRPRRDAGADATAAPAGAEGDRGRDPHLGAAHERAGTTCLTWRGSRAPACGWAANGTRSRRSSAARSA